MKQTRQSRLKRDISSEWFHALVESALDGIVIMDDKGRILDVNPAAEKIFGYISEDVIGYTVSEKFIPLSKHRTYKDGLTAFLTTEGKKNIDCRVEITAMRADQSEFPAELEVISISPETSKIFIAYIRDISKQKQAEQDRLQYAMNIKKTLLQTILAVSRTVEIRDPYTAGHQRRVAHLAANIARDLDLSEERIEGIFLGALIHDIGKIAVPSEILSRPGELSPEDIGYLKVHSQKGYEILEPVNFPWPVAEIALQHHEHLDGSGYPQGLRGDEILLDAQIVSVADIVESLTAHRPYRPAYPLNEVLAFINKNVDRLYDRDIVKTCVQLFKKGYHIDAIDMDELSWLASLME
ncbi:MAG: PAS domain S-box protein [Desulfobacteraceae bacterium]|nr:PAS domain S-box protein [Desulfobacteraceae bacterium]